MQQGGQEPSADPAATSIIWTPRGEKAFDALGEALAGRDSIIVATASPGMGKSTFIDAWRQRFGDSGQVWQIKDPAISGADFRRQVISALGIKPRDESETALIDAARLMLGDMDAAGKAAILIIDPADRLSDEALGVVHALAELRRKDRPLIRVLLAATSDTLDRLRKAVPEGNVSNIAAVTIPGLTADAAEQMVMAEFSRMNATDITLDDGIAKTIYRETNGVPGEIKALAARLAREASARNLTKLDRRTALTLITDMDVGGGRNASAAPIAAPESKPVEPAKTQPRRVDETPRAEKMPPVERAPESGQSLSGVVGSPSELPKSIRDSNDPRGLLRWAMGNPQNGSGEAEEKGSRKRLLKRLIHRPPRGSLRHLRGSSQPAIKRPKRCCLGARRLSRMRAVCLMRLLLSHRAPRKLCNRMQQSALRAQPRL